MYIYIYIHIYIYVYIYIYIYIYIYVSGTFRYSVAFMAFPLNRGKNHINHYKMLQKMIKHCKHPYKSIQPVKNHDKNHTKSINININQHKML